MRTFLGSTSANAIRLTTFILLALAQLELANAFQGDGEAILRGEVCDQEQQPVAGAVVKLIVGTYQDSDEQLPEPFVVQTDDAGKFAIVLEREFLAPANNYHLSLVAQADDGLVGWQSSRDVTLAVMRLRSGVLDTELSEPLLLRELVSFSGRILDPQGNPLPGVEVKPVSIIDRAVREVGFDSYSAEPSLFRLPRNWVDVRATRTDDHGRFVFDQMPSSGMIYVTLDDDSEIEMTGLIGLGEEIEIRLPQRTPFECQFIGDFPAEVMPRTQVRLQPLIPEVVDTERYKLMTFFVVKPNEQGRFNANIVPAEYSGRLELKGRADWYSETHLYVKAELGKSNRVTMELKKAVPVKGRITTVEDGTGIDGVTVNLNVRESGVGTISSDSAVTDKNGFYEGFAARGTLSANLYTAPPGFTLGDTRRAQLEIDDEQTTVNVPEMKLLRAARLQVRVVDDDGTPVANASVVNRSALSGSLLFRTNEQGLCEITPLNPNQLVTLDVRSEKGISNGTVSVAMPFDEEIFEIKVSPKYRSRAWGVVTSKDGTPLIDANIYVTHFQPTRGAGRSAGRSSRSHWGKTDDEGKFEFSSLSPGDTYTIEIVEEGFAPNQLPSFRPESGEEFDLGTIVLVSTTASVSGQIIDEAGRPISGAQVINRGDATIPLSTTTDAEGRYQLTGFEEGPVAILATKEGYSPSGVFVIADRDGADLTLLPKGTSRSIGAEGTPLSESERQGLAKMMLTRVHSLPDHQTLNVDSYLTRFMANIDIEEAFEWASEADSPSLQLQVLCEGAKQQPEKYFDEVLSLAPSASSSRDFQYLLDLAEEFKESAPDRTLRLAEELGLFVQRSEPPNSIYQKAQVAKLLEELGQHDAAFIFARDAIERAHQLEATERNEAIKGVTAANVAIVDLEGSIDLLETIESVSQAHRYRNNLAVAICRQDLARAIDIMPDKGDSITRMRLAWHIADQDLEQALDLLNPNGTPIDDWQRAQALAWVAHKIASEKPAKAYELIDESLAICMSDSEDFPSYVNFGFQAPLAGQVGWLADELGYPDMPSVVARVLACRVIASRSSWPVRQADIYRSNIEMAQFVAQYDRHAARWLLQPILKQTALFDRQSTTQLRMYDWIVAWSFIDTEKARELLEQQMEVDLIKGKGVISGDSELLRILWQTSVSAEGLREEIIRDAALWMPGEEQ